MNIMLFKTEINLSHLDTAINFRYGYAEEDALTA